LFGASDDILGAVESGTDIEKKIFDIYQTCRSKDEIDDAFDELQVAKKEQVETKIHQTKQKIINRLDEDVARRLKDKKEKSELMLNELQIALFQLVSLVL